MKLEIQTGTPPEEGRYVVFTPCAALSAREYCEPSIATWHGGRWHSYDPPWAWIGPLPVVHGNDCMRIIVATNAADAIEQLEREYDL